jgi:hypothetical protein
MVADGQALPEQFRVRRAGKAASAAVGREHTQDERVVIQQPEVLLGQLDAVGEVAWQVADVLARFDVERGDVQAQRM